MANKMNRLDFALAVLTNDVVIDNVGVSAVAMVTGWDEGRLCRLIAQTAVEVKARAFTTSCPRGEEMPSEDWILHTRKHDPYLQHPDDYINIGGGVTERGTKTINCMVPLCRDGRGWHLGAVVYWADLADSYSEGGRS